MWGKSFTGGAGRGNNKESKNVLETLFSRRNKVKVGDVGHGRHSFEERPHASWRQVSPSV